MSESFNYAATKRTVKTEKGEKWIILILWPQSKDRKDRQEQMKGADEERQTEKEMEVWEETEEIEDQQSRGGHKVSFLRWDKRR